jgi:hypothetical protein
LIDVNAYAGVAGDCLSEVSLPFVLLAAIIQRSTSAREIR